MDRKFAVLVVDDDVDLASNLKDILEAEGWSTDVAHDGQSALALCRGKVFALAIVDIRLPDMSGLELINKLAKVSSEAVYVIVTGYASVESAIEAVKQKGIIAYETKPLDMNRFLALIRQVFKRRQAEEAVHKERDKAQKYLDVAGVMLVAIDANELVSLINKKGCEILGYEEGEIIGKRWFDSFIPEIVRDSVKTVFGRLMAGEIEPVEYYENPVLTRSGQERIIAWHNSILTDETNSIVGILSSGEDITERKRAEEALRESGRKYRDLADLLPQTVFEVDEAGNFAFINLNSIEVFAHTLEDSDKGWNVLQMFVPEDRNSVKKNIQRVLSGKELGGAEYTALRKDGSTFPIVVYASPIIEENKVVGLSGIAIDITERKQAEENIKQAAEEWRTTFDSITDLVSMQDKDFRLIRVNKAFADAFNMRPKELIGKPCYEIVHGTNEPIPNCPHKKTIETKEPATVEFLEPYLGMYLEMSTSPIFDDKGEVVASVHVTRDITERKEEQEKLMLTDRLASVGELASGIAHEINNPLTSIIGFSELLLERDIADDIRDDLKTIVSEARRTAEVVKNLLTFARKHIPAKQLISVDNLINKVLQMRAYEQRVSNIQVITQFAPDMPEVVADYFQLQQVFLNIIINAEHFMIEAHNRGTLTITTERTGQIIRASFADDGPGISQENLKHLFDPFFTTKEVGSGTGLGLSICHGIITEHGGRIYVESEPGRGATFVVELPVKIAD